MPQTGLKTQLDDQPPVPVHEWAGEPASPDDPNEKFVVEYLRLSWASRVFLGKAILAGLFFGLLVAFLVPSRYESTVQLMPPDSQSNSGMMMLGALTAKAGGSNLGAMAGDLLGVKSSGALFVGVLGSRTVQDRLIDRFDLKKVYSLKLEMDARKKLAERTSVAEDRKSGIITINVTDRDPQRAAAIAQAYVEELNQLVAELSTSSAHRERVFLEERLTAVKKDLDDASQKFSQFASKNTAIDIKEQGRAMVQASATLEGHLIAAQSELKGLEEVYSPNNVRVRSVQARIAELQRQMVKLGGEAPVDGEPAKSSPGAIYPSIRELPILGVTWSDLYRRTQIQETVYETLTQQYELAKVQEAKETPSVKVLDAAGVPERKSFPPRGLITIAAGMAFLAAAILVLLARKQWNETDSADPTKLFAQEVYQSLSQRAPWISSNGPGAESAAKQQSSND